MCGGRGGAVIEKGEKGSLISERVLTGTISRVAQVSGERVGLVVSLPLGAAAVVVVGEDLVIVNVTAGQQRAPARATHGSGHVCVSQLGSLVPYPPQGPRHEVQRTWGIGTTATDDQKTWTNDGRSPKKNSRIGFEDR